ncbi:MAG: MFS transporter [Anaerolineae bacterium]|nr:MFS transporter [Anaerolineae bacterium]
MAHIANFILHRNSAETSKNQTIRTLAILSFINFAALGLVAPYLNIYLREIGMSGTAIGLLVSLGALLELLLNPVVNAWADRFRSHRFVYRWQIVIVGIAQLILSFFRLPLVVGGAFTMSAITTRGMLEMLSQLTITRLDQLKRDIFGKVRVWGSVGWATATLVSGAIIAIGSYPLAFLMGGILRLSALPLTSALPVATDRGEDDESDVNAPRNPAVFILMISQFLFFTGLNAYGNFLWIHMREGLGIPPEQIGFHAAIFAIAEFAPMLFIDRFIANWGIRKVLLFGMLSMSLEWLAFAFIPNVPTLIALQLARGVGFTAFTIGITVIVARVSKPVNVATNRALITVTMPALAMLLTSPLAGWIYDTFGARTTFIFSMVMGLTATTFLLLNYSRLGSTEKAKNG